MIVTETKNTRQQDTVFAEKVGKIFFHVTNETLCTIWHSENLLKSSKTSGGQDPGGEALEKILAFCGKAMYNKYTNGAYTNNISGANANNINGAYANNAKPVEQGDKDGLFEN